MRIRMRMDQSGTRTGYWGAQYATREWPPRGSVIEIPDDEAAEYCRSGMAEPVAVFAETATATVPEPELRTDTESGQALRRGPGRPRKATQPQEGAPQ
jgi:hypothetical protein